MKCSKCGVDNNLQDRTTSGGRCKSCQHPFTFDPKQPTALSTTNTQLHFTDPFFHKALIAITANESLFFTVKQFYYQMNQRFIRKTHSETGCLINVGMFVASVIFLFITSGLAKVFFPVLLFFIILAFIGFNVYWRTPGVKQKYFSNRKQGELPAAPKLVKGWLDAWARNNGPIAKLLPPPPPPTQVIAPASVNPEVTVYSFDRLVVTDTPVMAQFLLANNFHFENNCAVLCIDKYPYDLFWTVMKMLRRNPELKVYAVHDASPFGVHLVHRLRTEADWFANQPNVTMYDLGILPRQVLDRPVFVQQSPESAQAGRNMAQPVLAALDVTEIQWLRDGYFVELESFAPQALLRMITMGIARSRDPRASDSLVPLDQDPGYTGTTMVYVSDSFG